MHMENMAQERGKPMSEGQEHNHLTLKLWDTYSRREIHDIFSPDTQFQPRGGTWSQLGIIKSPNREGDYILLVTLGQSQGDHVFDESISEDGVLSWQSQPRQSLKSASIVDFINHDERLNTVHLFLRTQPDIPYSYLGPLGYLTHDATRERPVYFQWQILEWPPGAEVIESLGIELEPIQEQVAVDLPRQGLRVMPAPKAPQRRGTSTTGFRQNKSPSYADRDAKNAALGLAGEKLVLAAEIDRLKASGFHDLAERVTHVSVSEGDSAGYDVRSFEEDGRQLHIEVKTTRGAAGAGFFVSANELEFSRSHPDSYRLMRLFEFDDESHSANCFIHNGSLEDRFELEPIQYRVRLTDK